uniref:BACK domain-containing protein n=1 Tax=Elaeophora elaphi TaxID=1147741 RepID=A0A0R3S5R3_9BILA
MVEKDYEATLKSYCNVYEEVGNIYDDSADDILRDCNIITDDNDRYRLNSRFVEYRCPYLIPFMHFNEITQQYTVHTSASIDIIKEIFYALKYENINVKDWLQLERILKVANEWKLNDVKRCVVQKFVDGINEENCISVWRMCAKYLPDQIKKTFDYVLYTVNKSVTNGYNIDFFRLKSKNLFEILNADLLKVNDEMDVWILLKRWISVDRRRRIPYYRQLMKSIRFNLLNDEQKDEIKKDLVRFKITKTDDQSTLWSMNSQARIQRDLLLAIGGWEKTGPTNAVEVLDINGDRWQRVKTFEDNRRVAYHECVVINNKLYIIGGFEGSQYFNTVRCYDSEAKKWCELAPMHYARCYISACEINGRIIVAGGSDGRLRLRTAETYDASKNQWTKIRNMIQRRSDAAACAMGGKMFVAGGYTGEVVLQTIEMYIPEIDIWTEIAHMSSPRSGKQTISR